MSSCPVVQSSSRPVVQSFSLQSAAARWGAAYGGVPANGRYNLIGVGVTITLLLLSLHKRYSYSVIYVCKYIKQAHYIQYFYNILLYYYLNCSSAMIIETFNSNTYCLLLMTISVIISLSYYEICRFFKGNIAVQTITLNS